VASTVSAGGTLSREGAMRLRAVGVPSVFPVGLAGARGLGRL